MTGHGEDDFKTLPEIVENINDLNYEIISVNLAGPEWVVVVKEPMHWTKNI